MDVKAVNSGSQHSQGIRADITLKRGTFTLNADLILPSSGFSVLFGHSGSGKTTLLRCIAGLEKSQGQVMLGEEVWQTGKQFLPVHKRPLAYVFQEASLFEHLTAGGNLSFAMKRARQSVTTSEKNNIIELLGIGHTLKRHPANLSGGERQRVAIARALLSKPRLLLMDEPLAALDEQRKQEILPYLESLRSEFSLPVIYVTHSVAEVARLADHLVAMKDGKVMAQGTLEQTLADPKFPLQLGEEAGVVLDTRVTAIDSQWHLAQFGVGNGFGIWLRDDNHSIGKPARLRILARDVSLAVSPQTETSIQNALPCTVEGITDDNHPALALVKVRVGNTPMLSRMTRRSVAHLDLKPGKAMWAQVKSAGLV